MAHKIATCALGLMPLRKIPGERQRPLTTRFTAACDVSHESWLALSGRDESEAGEGQAR